LLATSIPPCNRFHSSYKDILFGSGAFNNLFAIVGNFRCNSGEFCLQLRPISFCNNQFREKWTSQDGKIVILRSITSKDKRIEKELIDGLSAQSSRYRFFHVIKEATEEMVSKFCDIDYKNEIAIIAEYNSNDKKRNVGVVRLFIDPN
jgi:hypothetical protein